MSRQQPKLNLLQLYRAHADEIEALADPTSLFALSYLNHMGGSARTQLQRDLGLYDDDFERIIQRLSRAELVSTSGPMLAVTPLGHQVLSEIGMGGGLPPAPSQTPPRPSPAASGGSGILGVIGGAIVGVAIVGALLAFTPLGPIVGGFFQTAPTNTPTQIAQNNPTATDTSTPHPSDTPTHEARATSTETSLPTDTPTATRVPVVTVPIGKEPFAITADPFGKFVYVGDRAGAIYRWAPGLEGDKPIAFTGDAVSWLAMSSKGEYLYATSITGDLFQFDVNNGYVQVEQSGLDTQIRSEKPMIVSPDGAHLVVTEADAKSNLVVTFDSSSLQQVGRFGTFPGPELPALRRDNAALYVPALSSNGQQGLVARYPTAAITTFAVGPKIPTVVLRGKPTAAILDRDETILYVTLSDAPLIEMLDAAKFASFNAIKVPGGIFTAALSPDGTRLVASSINSNHVFVIDTGSNALLQDYAVGALPRGVAISPDSRTAYVANERDSTIGIIELP